MKRPLGDSDNEEKVKSLNVGVAVHESTCFVLSMGSVDFVKGTGEGTGVGREQRYKRSKWGKVLLFLFNLCFYSKSDPPCLAVDAGTR